MPDIGVCVEVGLGCGSLRATFRDPLKYNAMPANLGLEDALCDLQDAALE